MVFEIQDLNVIDLSITNGEEAGFFRGQPNLQLQNTIQCQPQNVFVERTHRQALGISFNPGIP